MRLGFARVCLLQAWLSLLAPRWAEAADADVTMPAAAQDDATMRRRDESTEFTAKPARLPGDTPGDHTPRILSFHERNYFMTSVGGGDGVKFQLSLKVNLWPFSDVPSQARRGDFAGPRYAVYFAYTQRVIWQMWDLDNSSPVVAMDLQPELFFEHTRSSPRQGGCALYATRIGVQHISNGLASIATRAINWAALTLRGGCAWRRADPVRSPNIGLRLDFWSPPVRPFENPDLLLFMGPVRAELRVSSHSVDRPRAASVRPPWYGYATLSGALRPGVQSGVLTYQIEASWRPAYPRFWRFTPELFLQYFDGYGETVLSYDQRNQAFRIGLAFRESLLE